MDQLLRYPPQHIRCDVCGREYYKPTIAICHEPAVVRRYGTGGVAKVCVWHCLKCKYGEKHEFTSAVGCTYKEGSG